MNLISENTKFVKIIFHFNYSMHYYNTIPYTIPLPILYVYKKKRLISKYLQVQKTLRIPIT